METCTCCGAMVFANEVSVRAVQLKESFAVEVVCFECKAIANKVYIVTAAIDNQLAAREVIQMGDYSSQWN